MEVFTSIYHTIITYVNAHPSTWEVIPVAILIPTIVEVVKKLSGGGLSAKAALLWTHILAGAVAFFHWATTFAGLHPGVFGQETLIIAGLANTAYIFLVKNASAIISEARATTPVAPPAAATTTTMSSGTNTSTLTVTSAAGTPPEPAAAGPAVANF